MIYRCLKFLRPDIDILNISDDILIYLGLEIGGLASPNANHFWSKSESLWSTDSQYFWVTVNQFRPIANHFC